MGHSFTSSRIKPVSRSPDNASIRNLKCFKEVHHRLIENGQSARSVARYIQEEQHEETTVPLSTLVYRLNMYRTSVPAMQRAGPMSKHYETAASEVADGIDELKELHRLYSIQMERISIDFQTEKNIKKLLPTMSQEIRTAREILATSSQLKMDLGVNQRNLGKIDVETTVMADVAQRYAESPAVANVLKDGDSRRKVLGLAERLMAIADRAERNPEVIDQLEALAPVKDVIADEVEAVAAEAADADH